MWNTNNPSCCDIQGAASSVQHHDSLCLQPQMSLQVCKHTETNVTHFTVLFSTVTCCWPAQNSCPKCPTANMEQSISFLIHRRQMVITYVAHYQVNVELYRIKCKKQIHAVFLFWIDFLARWHQLTKGRKFEFLATVLHWNWELKYLRVK